MFKVENFKFTPAQKKVIEAFENAVYYYKSETVTDVMNKLYIDGERVMYELTTKAWEPRTVAYIIGENKFAHELSTSTVKSLAKKGVIDLENSDIQGSGLDILKVNIEFDKPKIYTNFTKVDAYKESYNSFVGKVTKWNDTIIAPTEQIDETIAKVWDENYVIESRTDFTATPFDFNYTF